MDDSSLTKLLAAAKEGSLLAVRTLLLFRSSCDLLARDKEGNSALHIAASKGHHEVVVELVSRYDIPSAGMNNGGETPLHLVCSKGFLESVRVLVTKFPGDLKVKDKYNNLPLHNAALFGHCDIVDCLCLEFGGDPQSLGHANSTCLHLACYSGSIKLVRDLLVKYHCKMDSLEDTGSLATHCAAYYGHTQLVEMLIDEFNDSPHTRRPGDGKTLLHHACGARHVQTTAVLINKYNLNPNTKDFYGKTALHCACSPLSDSLACGANFHNTSDIDCDAIVHMLLDIKCNPLDKDNVGRNALHLAASSGQGNIVKELVEKYNCPVHEKDKGGYTSLHFAVLGNHASVVQLLLSELGANVQARNYENNTAVHIAALNGYNSLLTLVETFGGNPHTKGHKGMTPLHFACCNGHLELVEKLIKDYHCDPMVRDDRGAIPLHSAALAGKEQVVIQLVKQYNCSVECSREEDYDAPLHIAAGAGHTNVVQVLLSDLRANLQARNMQNDTALHIAALNGHTNVVTVLMEEFGCNPHTTGFKSRTPLHRACEGGHLKLVEKLIDRYCCDPETRDDEGATALHIASLANKEDIVRMLLLKYKCSPYSCDNSGNTVVHDSTSINTLELLLKVMGVFPSMRNNDGKAPIDRGPLEHNIMFKPKIDSCISYLSKHAVGEYRHSPAKVLVFDESIVATLNEYSTYSLLPSQFHQTCSLCYVNSCDVWVCQLDPEESQIPSVLKLLVCGSLLMIIISINMSVSSDRSISKACSELLLVRRLVHQEGSANVSLRVLLVGNASQDREKFFNWITQIIVDKCNGGSMFSFTKHFALCENEKLPFPILKDFLEKSLDGVSNADIPDITYGTIYFLKFLFREYGDRFYIKYSQIEKQLQNRRIMTEKNPEEIHTYLRNLDSQGYLITTGITDNPQYVILNPFYMLHKMKELSHMTSDPLALLGLYSQRLISSVFVDKEFLLVESFLSKLKVCLEVPDPLVNLIFKRKISTHVADRFFYMPHLASSSRPINNWKYRLERVNSCGLRIIFSGEPKCFPLQLLNGVLLQVMQFFITSFLIEPYCPVDCVLWKGGIYWMVDDIEIIAEIINDGNGMVLLVRSDVCSKMRCTDIFVKIVDILLASVKSMCCGGIVYIVDALDPNALESDTIPCGNEMLWCDASTAVRALRTGKKNVQSQCDTKDFSLEKLNWLLKFSLQDKLFPMDYKVVLAFLETVSQEWQEIARELGISKQNRDRILEKNEGNLDLCCRQMIEECMIGSEVKFNWHSLIKTLKALNMEYLADNIATDWGYHEKVQKILLDEDMTDKKIDVPFLQQFAVVAEPHWKLLAPYINPSTPSGPEIKEEPALDQLQRWGERMCPTFGDLTEILSRLYIASPPSTSAESSAVQLLHTVTVLQRAPDDFCACHHSCPESLSNMCSTLVHSEKVDITGNTIRCRKLGFTIDFPPGTIGSPITVSICCSFKPEFSPPDGYEFVSPVYILHVHPETPFLKKVTLSLCHWAKSDGSDLSFGFCNFPDINLSHRFQVQRGGTFTTLTSGNSGTIDVEHFSGEVVMRVITGTIAWISGFFGSRANNYVASLVSPLSTRMSDRNPWLSAISLSLDHPTVLKNTLKWMEKKYPEFVWNNEQREVDFEAGEQRCLLQPHAIDKVNVKGKNAISKTEVDRLNRQLSIGSDIDLYPSRMFLEVDSTEFTSCSVDLKGMKDCSFNLTAPSVLPPASQNHGARYRAGSGCDEGDPARLREQGHTKCKPTLKLLHQALYDMRHRWYGLGLQLDLHSSTLNIIRHDCTDGEMMLGRTCEEWLNNNESACWEDIVDALTVMRHVTLAQRIQSAYCT